MKMATRFLCRSIADVCFRLEIAPQVIVPYRILTAFALAAYTARVRTVYLKGSMHSLY